MRVDTFHLPDDAVAGKAMHHGDVVGLPLQLHGGELAEVGPAAVPDTATQFPGPTRPKFIEGAALPVLGSLATLVGAAVFDDRVLVVGLDPPAEGASFIDGMECVDQRDGTGQRQAGLRATAAEAVDEFRLRMAGEAAFNQPSEDALQVVFVHARRFRPKPVRRTSAYPAGRVKVDASGTASPLGGIVIQSALRPLIGCGGPRKCSRNLQLSP